MQSHIRHTPRNSKCLRLPLVHLRRAAQGRQVVLLSTHRAGGRRTADGKWRAGFGSKWPDVQLVGTLATFTATVHPCRTFLYAASKKSEDLAPFIL